MNSQLGMCALLLVTVLATSASADDCDGDPGLTLQVPSELMLGESSEVSMQGPPEQISLLMISLGQGPTHSAYGDICLDFPLLKQFLFKFQADGTFVLGFTVPDDPVLLCLTVYMQYVTCHPIRGLSNQSSLTITDGDLGDMTFIGCVDPALLGLSVRDVIALADEAISGKYGICTDGNGCQDEDLVDVDGDGSPDVSLSDLNDALDLFNNAFPDCSSSGDGCVSDPACGQTFCTYTPGGWGTDCQGENPGCLRDAWFSTVFPSGLLIGDPDGADGDAEYSLLLTSSQAVANFLNGNSGIPGTLDSDSVDPTSSSAGQLADHLVAAKLNVAFDDAGVTGD